MDTWTLPKSHRADAPAQLPRSRHPGFPDSWRRNNIDRSCLQMEAEQ